MEDVGIPQPNRRQPSDIFEHAYDITNWPMVRRWPTTSRELQICLEARSKPIHTAPA